MSVRTVFYSLVVMSCVPSIGGAQPAQAPSVTPEVFISGGGAHPFRIEDRGFGSHLSVGGGVGLRWRRVGVEFEVNRTLGLSPEPAVCGAVNLPCVGGARSGLLSASLASANVLYFFSSAPKRSAQFYVSGGMGALWSKEVTSGTMVGPTQATMSELTYEDTGLAVNGGAGVRLHVTEAIVIRPEFRLYSSVAQSTSNLNVMRFSIAAGYQW